ncbi:glutamate receptor ionotropic, delta-1-like [Centruroides vittatus]|uniref:glutamate receptor ionotropic, delta-1-like n=1 Tax=Centruroides vittatus TaxID=120091 RepID=UPI00350FAD16
MTNDFIDLVDFSYFVDIHSIGYAVKQRKWKTSWKTITRPFTVQMWILIFVSILLAGLFISLISKFENKLQRNNKFWTVGNGTWFTFTSISKQGSNIDLVIGLSSRLSVGLWLLCCSVLSYSYGETLTSFLTARNYEWIPSNFYELASAVERGEFSCGTFLSGRNIFFKGAETGVTKTLKYHMDRTQNYMDTENAISEIENNRFAFIENKLYLKQKLKKYFKENLIISEDSLLSFTLAFFVRKEFPFTRRINKIVLHLFEAGIITYHKSKMNPTDYENDQVDVEPLKLNDVFGSFFLLLTGYLVATICLIVELLIWKIYT